MQNIFYYDIILQISVTVRFMKRVVGFAISAVLIFVSCFTAFGVNIDGNNQGTEWDSATAYKLFSGESNSSVNFGAVKVKFAPEEYAIYLCFTFLDPNLEQGNTLAGVSLSVENSPSYVLNMANSPLNEDIDKYEVSGAMYIDGNNGGTCEIRVGMKYGVPKKTLCSVRFIDYQGVPSNIYDFTLVNESYTETTERHFSPTEDNSDPAYNPDLLTTEEPKTTKPKKTTTEKSTKESTVKATTTKKKTTKESEKTTKSEKKTEVHSPSVYIYEKEVIISQVIVTVPVISTETITAQTETHSEISTARINITSGNKYKSIAGVICATAFVAIAAWGVVGAKKKNSEEQNAE